MDICVIGESNEFDGFMDALQRVSDDSVIKAGERVSRFSENEMTRTYASEYLHFIGSNTFVLPDFYRALITYCDYARADYVYCQCLRFNKPIIVTPTPKDFVIGQIIVKRWVFEELGCKSKEEFFPRVLSEYRGVEVSHPLCIELEINL